MQQPQQLTASLSPQLQLLKDATVVTSVPSNHGGPGGKQEHAGTINMAWPPTFSRGVGLCNSSNTCFLNSALQHLEKPKRYFLHYFTLFYKKKMQKMQFGTNTSNISNNAV